MQQFKGIKIDQLRLNVPWTYDSVNRDYLNYRTKPEMISSINSMFHFEQIFDEPVTKDTGKNGYTRSIIWGSDEQGGMISVMYNPDNTDMGILIDFTATGKLMYESLCRINDLEVNWRKIITKIYQKYNGHTSRMDVAIDFVNCNYSVDDIYKKLLTGEYIFIDSMKREISLKHIMQIGENGATNTICVGSRFSDCYLRIYDKKVEQGTKNGIFHSLANSCSDWIRVEGEFKKRECHRIGAMVSTLPTDDIEPFLANYIFKHWKLVLSDKKKS